MLGVVQDKLVSFSNPIDKKITDPSNECDAYRFIATAYETVTIETGVATDTVMIVHCSNSQIPKIDSNVNGYYSFNARISSHPHPENILRVRYYSPIGMGAEYIRIIRGKLKTL